jgi:hypothetical protein
MGTQIATTTLSQYMVETAYHGRQRIMTLVRIPSPVLTKACEQHGLPTELAEVCGGLLASVIDDLIAIGRMPKTDFERTKRKQRILEATNEPASCALRIAIAASPINGRAAVAHWDAICEQFEIGKLAWLLGMDTDTSYGYGRRVAKNNLK